MLLLAFSAKAQDFAVYKPITFGKAVPQQEEQEEVETITAYVYNAITKSYSKVKVQVVATDLGIRIRKYRKLTDTYWTPASGSASKLNSWEPQSKNFEFKGYLPGVGNIYF